MRHSSFGARFDGLRYTVFVKHETALYKTNVLTLLGPYTLRDWSFLILCGFVLAATLKATGFTESACFWVAISVMEQGELKTSYLTCKNKYLIMSWLFAALLIRTIYTSDIYSYLTKAPEAKDVPKSFNQLVLNNTTPIVCGESEFHYIQYIIDKTRLYINSSYIEDVYHNLIASLITLVPDEERLQETLIRLMLGPDKILLKKGFIRYEYFSSLEFHQWQRFAVLHQLTIQSYFRMAYLYPLIKLCGRAVTYTNNDASAFTQPRIWSIDGDHFFTASFESAIAAMDESGITNFLETRADVSYQIDILKDVRGTHGAMQSFNLVGFAEKSLSNKLTTSDDVILQGEKSIRGATIADFMAVWIAFFTFALLL